jgi:glycerol-3-phosphate dehydrogenase
MKGREQALTSIVNQCFDVCVIGGGATGAGCALDSQLRGMKTVLVDAGDFASGTSSKSTKIIHGGVRYLEEAVKDLDPAQYHVVTRALRERIYMLDNAPHLAHNMEFLLPCFHWAGVVYYNLGLKLYDWLSRDARIFSSKFLSKEETLRRMPTLRREELVGSVVYADGQFDDARYNIMLVESLAEAGGEALNYARVVAFKKGPDGRLRAAEVEDQFCHKRFLIHAAAFVNATGPFSDTVRDLANPETRERLRLSKGIHILLPLELMPSCRALLIPKTEDGRVLFAVPWMGRLLVGTTEKEVSIYDELYVTKEEIDYVLYHLNQYLECRVGPEKVVSGIAGARPLVRSEDAKETKKLARDDELEIDAKSGLISIMGGKWTTYRAMAEETINAVQEQTGASKTECHTRSHLLAGGEGYTPQYWQFLVREYGASEETARHLAGKFGTRASRVLELARDDPDLKLLALNGLPLLRAEVVYCARSEMATTIEDVLFRRTGLQLYSWRLAIQAAPVVAALLGKYLGWTAGKQQSAVQEYVGKINRYMRLARLESQATAEDEPMLPSDPQ